MSPRSPVIALVVCLIVSTVSAEAARQAAAFEGPTPVRLTVPVYTDADVARLLQTLDTLLPATAGDQPAALPGAITLWNFVREVQRGRLTPAQETRIQSHLSTMKTKRPSLAEAIERTRLTLRTLTVGKSAPEIIGKDLQGADMRLSDYRGKVVVLSFSAEWCGICKTMFPYERLMLDLYKNWPLAILSVETGKSDAAMRKLKADERLLFPSWWDPAPNDTDAAGPIAQSWGVAGFPSLYVLDRQGVIQFINLREEDLLKGVRQLLTDASEQAAAVVPRRPTPVAR